MRRPPLPASMAHGRRRLYGLSLDWGDSSQLIKSPRKHRIAEALPTSVGSKTKTSRPRTNFATTSCYRSFSSFPNFLPASIIAAETSLSERSAIAKLLNTSMSREKNAIMIALTYPNYSIYTICNFIGSSEISVEIYVK